MIRDWKGLLENRMAQTLIENWVQQGRDGFLLTDPDQAKFGTKRAEDPKSGVLFQFRWMPHREIRGDVAELERRGILNPNRDESRLFRDPRDPNQRHCFLCAQNIHECHPREVLIPMVLDGRDYFAGANFAWIERDHYTVMSAEHTDQHYSRHVLEAMFELHIQTETKFRVLFNGPGAGASIPWHLHYQITTTAMPIEEMPPGRESEYPTLVYRFGQNTGGGEAAHAAAQEWLDRDPQHSINILIASPEGETSIFVFPRDQRQSTAKGKGLVGGFEVAGDFVLSSPNEKQTFLDASPETARSILEQIRPTAG